MDSESRTMAPTEGSEGKMVNGDLWHDIQSRFKFKWAIGIQKITGEPLFDPRSIGRLVQQRQ
jgi:hypothetical protein